MNKKYKKLEELKVKKGVPSKDIAAYLKISNSYYSQIENRKRKLTYDMALKIAKFFNKKPDDLFYED